MELTNCWHLAERSVTDGEATKRYINLKKKGAAVVKDNEEVLGVLEG